LVEITISDGNAIFAVQGLDRLWSFKSQITIPLSHITGATLGGEEARGWWLGLRMPGTHIPGVIVAGTFYQHDGRVFYDVHNPDNAIVVELDHEKYDHLVVEVANPNAEVMKITAAIPARRR
jgi:hypothetical protein